ncbi:MAG: metallophosphoesterase [Paenisporosarcina sp.]
MKILVMSDTHGDSKIIDAVKEHVGPVDAIFHCGDSELDLHHSSLEGIQVVLGNCDMDSSLPIEVKTTVKDTNIFMTHGHLFQVKSSLMSLNYRAQELNSQIVLFGHSHLLGAEMINGVLFLNPGSLKAPRGRKEKSYAILEKLDSLWQVTFFSDTHAELKKVNFSFNEN